MFRQSRRPRTGALVAAIVMAPVLLLAAGAALADDDHDHLEGDCDHDHHGPDDDHGSDGHHAEQSAEIEEGDGSEMKGRYLYYGIHPYKDHVCLEEGLHRHNVPPEDMTFFARQEGVYHFTGDPAAYGYPGYLHPYHGHHPIPSRHGGGYCQIAGPHFHYWEPYDIHQYVVHNGWYSYSGPWGPRYRPGYYVHLNYYYPYYRPHQWVYVRRPVRPAVRRGDVVQGRRRAAQEGALGADSTSARPGRRRAVRREDRNRRRQEVEGASSPPSRRQAPGRRGTSGGGGGRRPARRRGE